MFRKSVLTLAALALSATLSADEKSVMVGGAEMSPSKTILENAVNSKDHTILMKALDASGLAEKLKGEGPFTVFAPTNAAFQQLPEGKLKALMQPEHREKLQAILANHVVAGRIDTKALAMKAQANAGKLKLKTISGTILLVVAENDKLWLQNPDGKKVALAIADVYQANGVLHVVETLMIPNP